MADGCEALTGSVYHIIMNHVIIQRITDDFFEKREGKKLIFFQSLMFYSRKRNDDDDDDDEQSIDVSIEERSTEKNDGR